MVLTRAQRRQSAGRRPANAEKGKETTKQKGDGEIREAPTESVEQVGAKQRQEAKTSSGTSAKKQSQQTVVEGEMQAAKEQEQGKEQSQKSNRKRRSKKNRQGSEAQGGNANEQKTEEQSQPSPKPMTFKDLVSAAGLELERDLKLCKEDEKSMKEQGYDESVLQGLGAAPLTAASMASKTQRGPQHQMTAAQLAQHSSEAVPRFHLSKIQERAIKRDQSRQNDSTGKRWFNMPAVKLTDDVKRELQLLKLRNTLDRNHFFKREDNKSLPKYFQMGRVEHSAAEFFTERTSKKAKKMSLVDELLQDSERRRSRKKRVAKIMATRKNYTKKGLGLRKRGGKVGSKHKKR